jgi:hypothetical protein
MVLVTTINFLPMCSNVKKALEILDGTIIYYGAPIQKFSMKINVCSM